MERHGEETYREIDGAGLMHSWIHGFRFSHEYTVIILPTYPESLKHDFSQGLIGVWFKHILFAHSSIQKARSFAS